LRLHLLDIEALPIVTDGGDELIGKLPNINPAIVGAGMLEDVIDGLLYDGEDCQLDVVAEPLGIVGREVHLWARRVAEAIEEVGKGGDEAAVLRVQHERAQVEE